VKSLKQIPFYSLAVGMTSPLGIFNIKLITFFEDLQETFPEEKDIRTSLEALRGAKKINPKLLLDIFYENVTRHLRDQILAEDEEKVIEFARTSIQTQFNEVSVALMIFDKHWPTMSEHNKEAIWKYMKILVLLSEKAKV
jgi:hypothetical protein